MTIPLALKILGSGGQKTRTSANAGNNIYERLTWMFLSPELETLDQLQGGDLSLELVAKLFPSFDDFRHGVQGLLSSGDVVLTAQDGSEVAKWQWQELFRQQAISGPMAQLRLRLTPQGDQRIG